MTDVSTIIAPDRSLAQRLAALEVANSIRSGRARLKRDIKAGRVSIIDVLLDPPDCAKNATLMDILMTVPKIGRGKANMIVYKARISPSKTLAGLTVRQRREVLDSLKARGA